MSVSLVRTVARPIVRPIARGICERPGQSESESYYLEHDDGDALLIDGSDRLTYSSEALAAALDEAPRLSPMALPAATQWWDFLSGEQYYISSAWRYPSRMRQDSVGLLAVGSWPENPGMTAEGARGYGGDFAQHTVANSLPSVIPSNAAWLATITGYWTSVGTDSSSPQSNEAIVTSWPSRKFHLYARSSGKVGVCCYDTTYRKVELDHATDTMMCMQAYHNGVDTLFFRINGGAWSSVACGLVSFSGGKLNIFGGSGSPTASGVIQDMSFSAATESTDNQDAVSNFLMAKAGVAAA